MEKNKETSWFTNISPTMLVCLSVLVAASAFASFVNFPDLGSMWLVQGSNTVGEAGKVYFAHRFQEGESIFLSGKEPPYYPAIHGALLHSSVGMVGWLLDLKTEELYIIGRTFSTVFTILAVLILVSILQVLRLSRWWTVLAALIFLAPIYLHTHAVSYRPDHWILFLSLTTCLVFLHQQNQENKAAAVFLVVVPTLAFFIKATGLMLLGCVALATWLDKGTKQAAVYVLQAVVLLGLALGLVQWGSGGAFGHALAGGIKTGYSLYYAFQTLASHSYLWPILFMPLFMLSLTQSPQLKTVLAFWLVALLASFVASLRTGAAIYYFVDAYAFATILFVYWLHSCFALEKQQQRQHAVAYGMLIVLFSLAIFSFELKIYLSQPKDVSVVMSQRFQRDRKVMANLVNRNDLKCYSDDFNLNVLLDKPMVIYPLLQSIRIKEDKEFLEEVLTPIRSQEYDVIVFTGIPLYHRGIPRMHPAIIEEVNQNYRVVESNVKYQVLFPKSRELSLPAAGQPAED